MTVREKFWVGLVWKKRALGVLTCCYEGLTPSWALSAMDLVPRLSLDLSAAGKVRALAGKVTSTGARGARESVLS